MFAFAPKAEVTNPGRKSKPLLWFPGSASVHSRANHIILIAQPWPFWGEFNMFLSTVHSLGIPRCSV